MFGKGKKQRIPQISAVIVSAGKASRMEGIDKQQAALAEIPVVIRAVTAFQECMRIGEIVLVTRQETIPDYYYLVQEYGLDKVSSVVGGGSTRQESVFRGIDACRPGTDFYAIHDGARPLIEVPAIEACIDAALEWGAAAVGVPIKDTVKVTDGGGFAVSTPDRSTLVGIQTPQIFAASLYQPAMEAARKEGKDYTDDCQLIEMMGGRVFVTPGSYANIKITTPEDLAIADSLLRYREEGLTPWVP